VSWQQRQQESSGGGGIEEGGGAVILHKFAIKHVTWHARGDYFASVAPTGNTQVRQEGSFCSVEKNSNLVDHGFTVQCLPNCICLNCALAPSAPHLRCCRLCWCTSWARG
jgi:hypothetical protein